jgi:hypothetical protein
MRSPSSPPLFIALLGIPVAGLIAITLDLELSRLIYGQASPVLLSLEIASCVALLVLMLFLRSRLAFPSAPRGLYRDALDFLAMARWHAAVKISMAGLLILPLVWFVLVNRWMFRLFESLGRRALVLSDVQNALDGGAVIYEHVLVGGLPLLFALHLLCRRRPGSRLLPWLLLPLFFAGTAIAVVVMVTVVHFSR